MTEHLFAPPHPTPAAEPAPPRQQTLDDLGTPLHEVTFVVFDLETTGGKAADGGITEIGAVKLRGGECVGTYQTLVNPGRAIPPEITVLTGITTAMVVVLGVMGALIPKSLESWAPYLFGGLCLLILGLLFVPLAAAFGLPVEGALTWMDWIGIVLFGGYVIFDLNRAQRVERTHDNAIDCALAVYLDFVNIFVRVIGLSDD